MNASGRPNTLQVVTGIHDLSGLMKWRTGVRNAYATYLSQGDSPGNPGLIPHGYNIDCMIYIIRFIGGKTGMRRIS